MPAYNPSFVQNSSLSLRSARGLTIARCAISNCSKASCASPISLSLISLFTHLVYGVFFSMESLRLLPPVPMTLREAGKSDWIDGFWVPKGTLLYMPVRRHRSSTCRRARLRGLQLLTVPHTDPKSTRGRKSGERMRKNSVPSAGSISRHLMILRSPSCHLLRVRMRVSGA